MATYNGKSIPTDGSKDIITWSEEQKVDLENAFNSLEIESGGNASGGYYIKFADGTMWQFGKLNRYWSDWLASSTEVTPSPYSGTLYEYIVSFPQAFVGGNTLVSSGGRRQGTTGIFVVGSVGNTTIQISRVGSFNTGLAVEISWFAIGRWK